MASNPVFSQFEVRLHADLLKDLSSTQTVFKHDLLDIDYVGEFATAGMAIGKLPCVQLEKISDTIVKLYVTVYRPPEVIAGATVEFGIQTVSHDSGQVSTQTSGEEWMRSGKTQTNSSEFANVGTTQTDNSGSDIAVTQTELSESLPVTTQTESSISQVALTQTDGFSQDAGATQTDNTEWLLTAATQTDNSFGLCVNSTQTGDGFDWSCTSFTQWDWSDWITSSGSQTTERQVVVSASQTSETRVSQTFADVGVETIAGLSTQVNRRIQAAVDVTDGCCQATVLSVDAPSQASVDIVETTAQTELIEDTESQSQTDLSFAWRSEQHVQATVEVAESIVQVCVDTMESDAQAVVDMVESTCQSVVETAESMVQAAVAIAESTVQTDLVGVSQVSQTNVSMALECDFAVQVGAEMSAGGSQTEQSLVDSSSSQTEISMSQQEERSVQAVVLLNDSQTEIDPPSSEAEVSSLAATSRDLVANQTFEELGTSILSQSVVDASFTTAVEGHLLIDGSSQTDPVTIIIGDASFLVKKLKSSAISPSKVVTYGNEIEIEVNPDVVGDQSRRTQSVNQSPVCEEKENDLLSPKSSFIPSAAITSPPGGLMIRSVGPRLRMPVSAGHQQHAVLSGRTPGGLLVRHPIMMNDGSLVTPSSSHGTPPTTAVRGPHPVVGGTVSCPFCSLAFIDSPALYEHLSLQHAVDQKTKWRQPKGREGKTIVPQKRTGGQATGEPEPPILSPIEPFNVSASGVTYRTQTLPKPTPLAKTPKAAAPVEQETGLFEDPVDPDSTKKLRGRQSKSGSTPVHGWDDSSPPPVKKLRTNDDDEGDSGASPRKGGKKPGPEGDKKGSTGDSTQSTPSGGRRGGRTPRSQKK